ncbi:hypothetical protein Taro_033730, partial [Colocasia esculenta]|nr:hypothetical protein [Colocasia esculenta]
MACGGATVPVLPRVVSVASSCVGVCPRAGFALRTFRETSFSLGCSVVSAGMPRIASALVPAALAGVGLVIPTGPCSRGSPPLLSSARGSSSRELGVGRVAEAVLVPCVVSSSESECCELLYPSELRAVFCKSS